jgi:hypothetical protein
MRRGTWCSPPRFFWPEEIVAKMVAGIAPTGLKDIITRMAKLTEEEAQAIREANDAHYIARPNRRECVSRRLRVDTLRSMVQQEITGNYRHMMGPVQFSEDSLWTFIREEVEVQKEQFKNLHSKHKETAASKKVLKLMSTHKEITTAIKEIDSSLELIALIEAIIDASGVTDKKTILKTLRGVEGHERTG